MHQSGRCCTHAQVLGPGVAPLEPACIAETHPLPSFQDQHRASRRLCSRSKTAWVLATCYSASRVRADALESLESGQHLFPKVFTAGRLCEAAVSQVTQCADGLLNFRKGSLVFFLHLGDLCFEALACVFDAGVDCL